MTVLPEPHGNRSALSRSIDVRSQRNGRQGHGLITDPKQLATDSSAKQIAEVVYEAVRTEKRSSAGAAASDTFSELSRPEHW